MNPLRARHFRIVAAAAFLLAAVLNPFVFRLAAPSASAVDLAAFALPDGSLPELCLASDFGAQGGKSVHSHCDFCRLIALPGLPEGRSDLLGTRIAFSAVAYAPQVRALSRQHRVQAAHARGPPLSVFA
ncbi:MAG: hypothetical protein H6878_13465 [Rhodobiaceae bacterium]|nr:hypothetical protein [Rhodobiaceae bacterium]MCC0017269.1 hypothetical protein [Rhodobiaceae bacterium]MCC0041844.1 hypothetical protein [Rhodobiaceae bacterium]MCC0054367.1 hypothetical protein [Rhodobiaceae bacterium]